MMKMGRGMREELVFYCCFLPVYGVVVGLSYGHVHCLLFTVTDEFPILFLFTLHFSIVLSHALKSS